MVKKLFFCNIVQQAKEFPHITPQFDINPEICVPLGGAVASSVLCFNQFAGTLLEKLYPENLAVFSDNLFVSNIVVRKLVMPDGTESQDLFHGCMQNHTMVPKNVSIFLFSCDEVVNIFFRRHYLTRRIFFLWILTVVPMKYSLKCTQAQVQYLGMLSFACISLSNTLVGKMTW